MAECRADCLLLRTGATESLELRPVPFVDPARRRYDPHERVQTWKASYTKAPPVQQKRREFAKPTAVPDRESRNMSWNQTRACQADATGVEYLDGLYGYALFLTRNHAEAEDLVQETYVRAIPAMGRLREGSNTKAWLFTILRNIWLNQLRKCRNCPQTVEIEAGDGIPNGVAEQSKDAHDLYVRKLEAEQVRAAIQELPANFREVILLREYEDLSYQEIASILDCPVGTVMSRLGRARAKLRVCFTQR
jgi:RNA polymerase sigma-70 factor, ECF subfamily